MSYAFDMLKKRVLLLFVLSVMPGFLLATVTLPSFFGDNMVLQQKTASAIWGLANAGSTVQLTTSWDKKNIQ